ncbi:MAG: hypothetical protein GY906_08880 [bacterium]|nr:hypothetical protein [bacterium]
MFLVRLRRSQQIAFWSLAHEMVTADSTAAVGEVATLARLGREMGLDPDFQVERLSVDEAAERFDTDASRRLALLELLALGYADRDYSMVESALVRRLAMIWRVNSKTLEEIESWVLRRRRLKAEALALFAGG